MGDVDGDHHQEIITAPQSNGGPHIRVFNHQGGVKAQFFAGNKEFRGGFNIITGELNKDNKEEIVLSRKPGYSPEIIVYNIQGELISNFYAYSPGFKGEIDLSIADVDSDYRQEIIVSPGRGGGPHIRVFDLAGNLETEFWADNKYDRRGVYLTTFIKNEN